MIIRYQVVLTSLSKSTKHFSIFIVAIVLTRYLSKEDYGSYLQVMLLVNTGAFIAIFGIPSSIYYFLPKVNNRRLLMRITIKLLIFIATVVSVILYVAMPKIASGMNNLQLFDFAGFIAAFVFLQIPIRVFEPFMITTNNVARFVAINTTFNIGLLFALLIPVLLGFTLFEMLRVLFIFYLLQFGVIFIAVVYTYFKLENDSNGDSFKMMDTIHYSAPVGLSGAINELSIAIDKLIVSGYFNPSQLAVYARGAMDIPMLNVVANSFGNTLMPRLVDAYNNDKKEEMIALWHRSIRMMALIIYPAFVFFLLTAQHLIPFLFTEAYLDSVIIFQIYCVSLITRITSYDLVARAVGRTPVMFRVSLMSLILNIVLSITLIKTFGIIGAPIATVLVLLITRVVHLAIVTRLLDISMAAVFPWRSLFSLLFMAIICSVSFWPILWMELNHFVALVLCMLLYGTSLIVYLKYSHVVEVQEKTMIRSLLPKYIKWFI